MRMIEKVVNFQVHPLYLLSLATTPHCASTCRRPVHPTMPNAPNQPTKATYIAQISSLESSLLADLSDPNPLLPLLALARNESAEVVHKAVWALHRVFIPLISKGSVGGLIHANLEQNVAESVGSGDIEGGESRAVKAWVRERLVEYIRVLGGLLRDREAALRVSPLHTDQLAVRSVES